MKHRTDNVIRKNDIALDVYKDMLTYYYDNIGEQSKYAGELITPKAIQTLTIRYLELGGELPLDKHKTDREEIEEV